jgi:hypothetical protein
VKHVKDITVAGFGRFKELWGFGVSQLLGIIGNIISL